MTERKRKGKPFWDKEYQTGQHLALSTNPSEDLIKFTHWLTREYGRRYLNPTTSVLDLGCGNGRNLLYLTKTFGPRGVGYDTSKEALAQAKELSRGLPLEYQQRSIAEPLLVPTASQTLVLDMMTSHLLKETARENLHAEIARVLKPNGWLFFKTFLREGDVHAERLLREHPATEAGSYIHPKIGGVEHVFTEAEIATVLDEHFIIHRVTTSHRHYKRRSISVYAQRTTD